MVMAEPCWRNHFVVSYTVHNLQLCFLLTSPNHEMLPASQITVIAQAYRNVYDAFHNVKRRLPILISCDVYPVSMTIS